LSPKHFINICNIKSNIPNIIKTRLNQPSEYHAKTIEIHISSPWITQHEMVIGPLKKNNKSHLKSGHLGTTNCILNI
jgi:hypothetical protein